MAKFLYANEIGEIYGNYERKAIKQTCLLRLQKRHTCFVFKFGTFYLELHFVLAVVL